MARVLDDHRTRGRDVLAQHFTRSLEWTENGKTGKRAEEIHDERTKRAPRVPCSGNTESRERQTA